MRRLLAGLAAHVRPVFMVPAVGTSVYGGLLAATLDPAVAAVHALAVGDALFVAHLRDGYVDGHLRGEESPPLSATAFRRSALLGSALALVLAGVLASEGRPLAAASVVALLALASLHAPYLDLYTVPVTVDYPLGIAVTVVGGYLAQTGRLDDGVVAVAVLLACLLAGIKVGIDRLDSAFDRTIGKRTVPVVLGPAGARRVAVGIFAATACATVGTAVAGVVPASLAVAALAPAGCLVATAVAPPVRAVRVQMALTYGFGAVAFLALCGRDCAGWALAEALYATATGRPG